MAVAKGTVCVTSAVLCLLALEVAAQVQVPGLEALWPELQISTDVYTAQEFLEALKSTAGSSQGQLINLRDDIYIREPDLQPYATSLPFNGGNRTLVLRGAKGSNGIESAFTVMDWGKAVNLHYHPVGHAFYTYHLILQGMAPPDAGFAAGLGNQMVGGVFWPTATGEPGHMMGYWRSVFRLVKPNCNENNTQFTVQALQTVLGRSDTVRQLNAETYYVGQELKGSVAVRVIATGDTGGNIKYSLWNTTITCTRPSTSGAPLAPSTPAVVTALAAKPNATVGIAGSADELLTLLAAPNMSRIILGGHISLQSASWQNFSLPIVLQARNLMIESNDGIPKVLDLGSHPQLLYLSADTTFSFSRVILQGAAPPSSGLTNRSRIIAGSPVWPTIDGAEGHQLLFINSTLKPYLTPCNHNSTQLTIQTLQGVLGQDAVQSMGYLSYAILPQYRQAVPIRNPLGEQVGSTPYTFDSVVISCQEDPGLGPGSLQQQAPTEASAPAAQGDGMPSWLAAVIAVVVGGAVLAGTIMGLLLWRRRRSRLRRRQAAVDIALGHPLPVARINPHGSQLDYMESGQLVADSTHKMAVDDPSDPTSVDAASKELPPIKRGEAATSTAPASPGWRQAETEASPQLALWRSRFGVVEGLEIGEVLGRGGYGRVYRGRWNGAVVAVKVVEHRITRGGESALSREPLLCLSVSHPNCITTYKLSVIRLLGGVDLLDESPHETDSSPSVSPVSAGSQRSADTAVTEDSNGTISRGSTSHGSLAAACPAGSNRRVYSLLSGTEGVLSDPNGPQQPGLYETWIVSEYCDRGTLVEALSKRKLHLADGSPNMEFVYLCLLDIASGMHYLHSLGIMHSDLKPANVLLKGTRNSKRGFVCKLADFGLSRMLEGSATHVDTGSLGTPTHAAPELLKEGHLSPPADVFAYGILAWELVAGEEVYRGMRAMQVILQVTHQGIRPPPLPHCPPALEQLMQRCWQEDPAERPTFADLLPQLQQQLAGYRQAEQQQRAAGSPREGSRTTILGGES